MLDSLVQQFAGGGAGQMEGSSLFGGVAQMLEGSNNEHGIGAISQALGSLGGAGLGQSVRQGTAQANPQQRNDLAGMFLNAVSKGGGSPANVLSQLGIGGNSSSSEDLAKLAEHVGNNHPNALASELGTQFGNGKGSGMLSLLGNPMVREVGMNLAKRLL